MHRFILFFILGWLLGGCSNRPPSLSEAQPVLQIPEKQEVILATTTSTQDSGLLDLLIPIFENQTGYIVKTVAVGSGQALEMGRQGNADVLLVHSPDAEKELLEAGYGSDRYLVMHNDFVIVGPDEDGAGIVGSSSASAAFQKIAASQSAFISRGDDSGTHKKELEIWRSAGIDPEGSWYQESGQGMGATLTISSEKNAYTLTDRATYLANRDTIDLVILVEGDPGLLNVYHVIVVNREAWPEMNREGAQAFAEFMNAPGTQALIRDFGVEKYGQPLFIPDADKTDADLGLE
jgi:tungstate transport system substrate-binding protein